MAKKKINVRDLKPRKDAKGGFMPTGPAPTGPSPTGPSPTNPTGTNPTNPFVGTGTNPT
jgi:hypothetical protein